jgi:hypothetical protein
MTDTLTVTSRTIMKKTFCQFSLSIIYINFVKKTPKMFLIYKKGTSGQWVSGQYFGST